MALLLDADDDGATCEEDVVEREGGGLETEGAESGLGFAAPADDDEREEMT